MNILFTDFSYPDMDQSITPLDQSIGLGDFSQKLISFHIQYLSLLLIFTQTCPNTQITYFQNSTTNYINIIINICNIYSITIDHNSLSNSATNKHFNKHNHRFLYFHNSVNPSNIINGEKYMKTPKLNFIHISTYEIQHS